MKARIGVTDMYERRSDWLDRQISKLVLGQTTTTDAVPAAMPSARSTAWCRRTSSAPTRPMSLAR